MFYFCKLQVVELAHAQMQTFRRGSSIPAHDQKPRFEIIAFENFLIFEDLLEGTEVQCHYHCQRTLINIYLCLLQQQIAIINKE
jgi:hypothetical protein